MKHFFLQIQRALGDNPINYALVGFALIVIFLIVVYSIYSFVEERENRRRRRESRRARSPSVDRDQAVK